MPGSAARLAAPPRALLIVSVPAAATGRRPRSRRRDVDDGEP
ncbi:hypothetical protein ACFCXA_12325 [Streptomyces virginiae]